MTRKVRSIFAALDGGHLDGSVFDAHVAHDQTEGGVHAKSEPKTFLGRYGFWRRATDAADGEDGARETRPEPRL